MWESWERTKEVNRLQKELEKVRRYGDSEQYSCLVSPLKKRSDYFDDIKKGYEGAFGKIGIEHSRTATKTGESIISNARLIKKRSKSSLYSATSYVSAVAKLGQLTHEEEKLKLQKDELMKALERSRNKYSGILE